jgi:outer membrane protein assembly factor BamB
MNRGKFWRVALAIAVMLLLASSVWGAAGDQLWEQEFSIPNYPNIAINAMSVSPTSVIICGNASGGTSPQIGFVKALDVTTHQIKWEYELISGSQTNNFNAITIDGGIALVLGTYFGVVPVTVSKTLLRAFNADTGQILWTNENDLFQNAAPGPQLLSTPLMATANNRTYLAVTVPSGGGVFPGAGTCIVRALQEKATLAPLSLLMD